MSPWNYLTLDLSFCLYLHLLYNIVPMELPFFISTFLKEYYYCYFDLKGLFEKGGIPQWPIFQNLKRLNLGGWCLNSDFGLVSFFLQSPNLEQLTLHGDNVIPISCFEQCSH